MPRCTRAGRTSPAPRSGCWPRALQWGTARYWGGAVVGRCFAVVLPPMERDKQRKFTLMVIFFGRLGAKRPDNARVRTQPSQVSRVSVRAWPESLFTQRGLRVLPLTPLFTIHCCPVSLARSAYVPPLPARKVFDTALEAAVRWCAAGAEEKHDPNEDVGLPGKRRGREGRGGKGKENRSRFGFCQASDRSPMSAPVAIFARTSSHNVNMPPVPIILSPDIFNSFARVVRSCLRLFGSRV